MNNIIGSIAMLGGGAIYMLISYEVAVSADMLQRRGQRAKAAMAYFTAAVLAGIGMYGVIAA